MITYVYSDLHLEIGDSVNYRLYGIGLCYKISSDCYFFKSSGGDYFDIDKRGCLLYRKEFNYEQNLGVIKEYLVGGYTIVTENDILRNNQPRP
jgi:hypothetical protein